MADTTSTITVDTLEITVDKVFDVTMAYGRPGGVVLHGTRSRIILSAAVLADIDQARREAQADAELDANRQAGN